MFSWTTFWVAVAVNVSFIGLIVLAQSFGEALPLRRSFIPGTRQKFLYAQDFWTMMLGDIVGLSLMWGAFANLVDHFTVWHWLAWAVIGVVAAVKFHEMCLSKDHKPDYGFPEAGKTSWAGYLHLPYFGLSLATAILSFWWFILPGVGKWVFLMGGCVYLISVMFELKAGNFDPLRLEKE